MMYEDIYGPIHSWKKEFSLQNSITGMGMHLPLVVYFLYTNIRSLEITQMDYYTGYLVLFFPFLSISYTIFHMFRGAHETIFLVSGRTIVFAGFISLSTDFLLRVGSTVGLLSYLLRAARCIDQNFECIEMMIHHGEEFCELLPANGLQAIECCECEGGSIPTDTESLMFKTYAFLLFLILFFYEFGWVIFFHYQYNKKEEQRVKFNVVNEISSWKKFLLKMVQASVLMVTFAIINIPVLGMYRPSYRQIEQYIRVLFSIIMAILYVLLDDLLNNHSVLIGVGIVIPIHVIAYVFFERAFSQQDSQDSNTSTSIIKRFKTERFSVMNLRAKELFTVFSTTSSHSNLLSIPGAVSESKTDLDVKSSESKGSQKSPLQLDSMSSDTKEDHEGSSRQSNDL